MDCRYTGCLSSQDGSIPGERREKGTASVLFEPLTNVYRLYRDLVVSRSHVVSHVGAVAHGNVKECYILRMRVANFVADFLITTVTTSVVEYTCAVSTYRQL